MLPSRRNLNRGLQPRPCQSRCLPREVTLLRVVVSPRVPRRLRQARPPLEVHRRPLAHLEDPLRRRLPERPETRARQRLWVSRGGRAHPRALVRRRLRVRHLALARLEARAHPQVPIRLRAHRLAPARPEVLASHRLRLRAPPQVGQQALAHRLARALHIAHRERVAPRLAPHHP